MRRSRDLASRTLLWLTASWFLVAVPPLNAQAAKIEAPVRFELRLGEELLRPETGVILLQSLDDEQAPIRIPSEGGAFVETALPAGSRWRVSGEVPAYWAAENELVVPRAGAGALHRLFLWPEGTIRGQLRLPEGSSLPSEIVLKAEVPLHGKSALPPRGVQIVCPVDPDGAWQCSAPAAELRLRLDLQGFAPHQWALIRLASGKTAALGVATLESVLVAGSGASSGEPQVGAGKATATLRLHLEPPPDFLGAPLTGGLLLASGAEEVELMVEGTDSVVARLPPGTTWKLSTRLKGLWRPTVEVKVGEKGSSTELPVKLWRSGTVEGRWTLADPKRAAPERVRVEIMAPPGPPGSSQVPTAIVPCLMRDDHRFECTVAAGSQDLIVRADGFVAHYFWGQTVTPDKPLSVGALRLIAGASLVGRVVAEEGEIQADRCEVRLVPLQAPGNPTRASERMSHAGALGKLDARGFFQIAGIAPGTYTLEVTHPGYAPARLSPVEIWPASESSITEALILKRPLALTVLVRPPTALGGRPWGLEIDRAASQSGGLEDVFDGPVDEMGQVRIDDQQPGRYWITVLDAVGNRVYSNQDVVVSSSQDAIHEIDLDLVLVEGRILLGDEPLPAVLYFGGRFSAVRTQMESDEEGNFAGLLSRDGRWRVEIHGEAPPLQTKILVEVRADRHGEAFVEIELPKNEVYGRVVDAQDRPAAFARVNLGTRHFSQDTMVDASGEFRFFAVPQGPIELSAEAPHQASATIIAEVAEDQSHGPFELRLQEFVPWSGRVVSERGPVVGAALDLSFGPGISEVVSVRTGLDGTFDTEIPAQAERVHAVISPPGFCLTTGVASVAEPSTFRVSQAGGTLRVEVPFAAGEQPGDEPLLLFWQEGEMLSGSDLYEWAQGHGVTFHSGHELRVPKMATGEYRVCLGPKDTVGSYPLERWLAEDATCVSGFLGAGAELVLDVSQGQEESQE